MMKEALHFWCYAVSLFTNLRLPNIQSEEITGRNPSSKTWRTFVSGSEQNKKFCKILPRKVREGNDASLFQIQSRF